MHARKACLLALVPLFFIGAYALSGKDGATPQPHHPSTLALVAEARVALAPIFTTKDSFEVHFRLAAPAEEKYQRHQCLISANRTGFVLLVPKVQQWMLRRDTLMVLSEVDLSLRAPRALASSLVLEFKFENLDQPQRAHGAATLVIGEATPSKLAPPIDLAVGLTKISVQDSVLAPQLAASDSARQRRAADSTLVPPQNEESTNVMPWILIGLLLSGFAVMALLNILNRKQAREAKDKIVAIKPIDAPNNSRREEARPTSFEQMIRRREPMTATTEASAPIAKEEKDPLAPLPENAVPAASVLALTPASRNTEMIIALPDLQSALAQLSAVTVEVQKAVGKQFDALQKISTQFETAPTLPAAATSLQNPPRFQFAFEPTETTGQSGANKNAMNLDDFGVRVSTPPAATEKYEEIADAIASLVAASKIKTPPVAAQALAPKLELLQRLQTNLEALAAYCRTNAAGVSVEAVENLSRRVFDLRMSYEAWASDQTAKLPLMLQRPTNGGENASRKIVESLLDGLYETRKLAAQGGLYFERRLAQLLEQDLPKLRAQFSDYPNAELQKILDGLA